MQFSQKQVKDFFFCVNNLINFVYDHNLFLFTLSLSFFLFLSFFLLLLCVSVKGIQT